jgi:hypothetical protein
MASPSSVKARMLATLPELGWWRRRVGHAPIGA